MSGVGKFTELLDALEPLLDGLKRFESTLSVDGKLLYQGTLSAVQNAKAAAAAWQPSTSGLAGYLSSGDQYARLKAAAEQLGAKLTAMVGGSIPLPRSSKDELVSMKSSVVELKLDDVNAEQLQLVGQIRKCSVELKTHTGDLDVIENHLDDAMRAVLMRVFTATELSHQVLTTELASLSEGVAAATSSSPADTDRAAFLSLALNSLQRLHANQMSDNEEEESDEDDDDDDMFYMPLAPVFKLADEGKFYELAKPIPGSSKRFEIVMDDGPEDGDSANEAMLEMPTAEDLLEELPPGLTSAGASNSYAAFHTGGPSPMPSPRGTIFAPPPPMAPSAAGSQAASPHGAVHQATAEMGAVALPRSVRPSADGALLPRSVRPSADGASLPRSVRPSGDGAAAARPSGDGAASARPSGDGAAATRQSGDGAAATGLSADGAAATRQSADGAAATRHSGDGAAARQSADGGAQEAMAADEETSPSGAEVEAEGVEAEEAAALGGDDALAAQSAVSPAAAPAEEVWDGMDDRPDTAERPSPAQRTSAQRTSANKAVLASAIVVAAAAVPAAAAAADASAGTMVVAASPAAAAADVAAGVAAPDSTVPPDPEKLKQFVNFLNGENPGACMFHAQMRLSIEGCTKLATFLRSSNRVRALSLSHNFIGDDGLAIICGGLACNKSVTALDLPDNDISDSGIQHLIGAIQGNQSLTQLQLAHNKIGDVGAAALAEIIKNSTSLKKVGLAHNQIGKAGCQALIVAISTNQSLKQLQLLPGNPVGEKDAKALAKALKRNKKFSIRTFLGMGDEADA